VHKMVYIQELRPTGNENEYQVFYHWVDDTLTDDELNSAVMQINEEALKRVI
jgi:hypothetical protein